MVHRQLVPGRLIRALSGGDLPLGDGWRRRFRPLNSKPLALVAQWIEHLTTDQKVRGSSPFERARVGRLNCASM